MGNSLCRQEDRSHPIFHTREKLGRPLVFGHRGGSKNFAENTQAAFQDALDNGADGVEFDVFLTKDGKVVCFHDDDTSRLIAGDVPNKKIIECNWAGDLENLRIKQTLVYDRETLEFKEEDKISLLTDVLDHFKERKAHSGLNFFLNIELKPANPLHGITNVGREVATMVKSKGMENQCTIVSFDVLKLMQVENTVPGLHSGWQYDDDVSAKIGNANEWYKKAAKELAAAGEPPADNGNKTGIFRWFMENQTVDRIIGATIVDLEWTVCDKDTIEKFHKRKFAVGCFTLFPTDLAAVHEKPPADAAGAYEHGKNVLRNVILHKADWIETDSVANSIKAIAEIKAEGNQQ